MKKALFILFLSINIFILNVHGQFLTDQCKIIDREAKNYTRLKNLQSAKQTAVYDVKFYSLDIKVDPAVKFIEGNVSCFFSPTKNKLTSIVFDLSDSLLVDSVWLNGEATTFSHQNNQVLINSKDSLIIGEIDTARIFYRGRPLTDGIGSFTQDTNRISEPVIWTLSEPYGSSDWWPCKDNLTDKADSVELKIEVPLGKRAASIGLLLGVDTTQNTATYHWKTNYPTVAYLVAIAVAEYDFYEEKVAINEDSLLMHHFLYKNQILIQSNNSVFQFMEFFDSLFGTYPFIKEKYGHASFTFGGGIEHQTMSFMGNYGGELTAHELAHQWFGNKITCSSWTDLWLNEGFAAYLTAITYEFNVVHSKTFWPIVKANIHNASFGFPNSSVFKSDTTEVFELFNPVAYQKGAAILHSLRWKIGDQAFFDGVKNYISDSSLIYSFAQTDDLIKHLETTSNQDLTEYFNDWFYGKGFPTYLTEWSQSNNQLSLQVDQLQSDPSVYFFDIPVPFQLYSGEWDTTVVVDPKFSGQSFTFDVSKKIDSITFDREDWILGKSEIITSLQKNDFLQNSVQLVPNPSNGIFNLQSKLKYHFDRIEIYSPQGKRIELDVIKNSFDLSNFSSGMYIVRIFIEDEVISKKIMKL